ncbi:MAG: DUF6261 family protein [Prevotellaceae bacterium]|jgi:Arc/MetJ-type ribon-helix-helix transcriptional regulator|nr:DUF6261 family protein [Prevotellaceae bacterium]
MKKEIIRVRFENLRNESHVEYNSTFRKLVAKYTPETLGIKALYDEYETLFADEESALDIVRKSELTVEIHEQDSIRDGIFRGMSDAVKSALNHFNAEKRAAARKIEVIFANYGNIAVKTLDQETAAINDILRELRTPDNAPKVTLLGLGEWVSQLETENDRFDRLMLDRYYETAQRPALRMRDTRLKVDTCIRQIFDRIEALALVNGADAYEGFMRDMNAVSERYKNIMAQEKGARGKSEKL